jgi:hypothetical protein
MIRRLSVLLGALVVAAVVAMAAAPAGASGEGLTSDGGASVTAGAPSPRAAATYTITGHSCPAGQARIKVSQQENGRSGVNYFKQVAQGQVFKNGAWQNRTTPASVRSTQFPNDLRSFTYAPAPWVYSYNSEFNLYHRVLVKLQYWNNSGTPNYFGDDFIVYSAAVFNRCPG